MFCNLSCQNNDGIFAKNKLKTGRNANKAKIFLTLPNFCETKQTQQTLNQAVQKNFWNVRMNDSSRLKDETRHLDDNDSHEAISCKNEHEVKGKNLMDVII